MAVLSILPMTIGARSTQMIPVLIAPMAHKWLPQAEDVEVAMAMMRTTLSTGNSTSMDVAETRVPLIQMRMASRGEPVDVLGSNNPDDFPNIILDDDMDIVEDTMVEVGVVDEEEDEDMVGLWQE